MNHHSLTHCFQKNFKNMILAFLLERGNEERTLAYYLEYDLSLFINEMKEMVSQLVQDVKYKTVGKSIGIEVVSETISSAKNPKKRINKSKTKNDILKCPKCQIGIILKGKTAYGCSEWKTGCNFRIPFEELQKRFQTTELSSELLARWKES